LKYIIPILQGIVITVLNLLCPVLVLLALPFIRWDKQASLDRHGKDLTVRGDLPDWLSWLSTPDERLPGGLYEPAHRSLFDKYGKWVASWYWLGVRNCFMGLSMAVGKAATGYIPDVRGWYQAGDVWQYSVQLGPLRFVTGHKVYRLLTGEFWAAPCFTLMMRKK